MEQLGAGVFLAVVLLVIVLVIAWIVLPIAVIGTKPLLRELIAETKMTNALLKQRMAADTSREQPSVLCGECRKPIAAGTRVCPHCGTKLAAVS